jgi:hypothetical protein
MHAVLKTTLALLIAGASLASLSACSQGTINKVFIAPNSYPSSEIKMQNDVKNNAIPNIEIALAQGKTLAEIRPDIVRLLQPSVKHEQVNLIDGSCGLHGPKDYSLVVGDGYYVYVYTTRTKDGRDSFDKKPKELLSEACGIFG